MDNYFDPGMERRQVDAISALGLAHMGDAVYELLVRSWLCSHGAVTVQRLHKETIDFVAAPAQAQFMEKLEPMLTPEEHDIYRRGKNTHVHGVPRHASPKEYAMATGLECLFGHLFLDGKKDRANELFSAVMEELYGI